MDAVVRDETPRWEPHVGMGGHVEVVTHYYDDNVTRMCFGGIPLWRYIELWDKGKIDFQIKGKQKPLHLPTREEAARELALENARLTEALHTKNQTLPHIDKPVGLYDLSKGFRAIPPAGKAPAPKAQKREPLFEKAPPKVRIVKEPKAKTVPKVRVAKEPPPPPPPPQWDPEECAKKFLGLSEREQEILRLAPEWKIPEGLPERNAGIYFSMGCTRIGIPVNTKYFNRREELRKVLTAAEKLQKPEPILLKAPTAGKAAKSASAKAKAPEKKPKPVPDPKRIHARLIVDSDTQRMILLEYRKAAQKIRGRGEEPNVATLCKELNLKAIFVGSFLRQYPEFETNDYNAGE